MGKFLTFALIGAVVIVLVCGVLFAFAPSTYEVSRALTMRADPEELQGVVEDLPTWPEWSHWNTVNYESLKSTFSDPGKGTGAVWTWTMDEGPGSLTVTASKPAGVWFDLTFGPPEAVMRSKGVLQFGAAKDESGEVQEGLTEVTFTSRGALEGGWRLLGFFTDAMMGPSFEESLAGLKARVESDP